MSTTPVEAEALPFASAYHTPVLCRECVAWLVGAREEGGVFVDATLGGGGHTEALLRRAPTARIISIDRDAEAIEAATTRLAEFDAAQRWSAVHANFEEGVRLAVERAGRRVDGVLLDLGVSSRQLDDAARGFSHRLEGPLDMRMSGAHDEDTDAATVVNAWDRRAVAALFRHNADCAPRLAAKLAAAIEAARPLETTAELADVIRNAVPPSASKSAAPSKVLARVFQAIRIVVNDELGSLERLLGELPDLVRSPGGRVVVLSYHSLEDRRVKRAFRSGSPLDAGPGPTDAFGHSTAPWRPLVKGTGPSEDEVARNPRARSARLRVAERTPFPSSG